MKFFTAYRTLVLTCLILLALLLSLLQPLPVLNDVCGRVIYAEDSNGAAVPPPPTSKPW